MKKVLMLLANDFEDSEAQQPLQALRQAGGEVDIASPEAGKLYRGKKNKTTISSTLALSQVDPDQFDLLVIPGGYSPDHLRMLPDAVNIVRSFFSANKPVAAICHGPQLLITADVLRGRTLTCFESIIVDVRNAGGEVEDQALVVDGNLITSRNPNDLPQFCGALVSLLKGEKIPSTVH